MNVPAETLVPAAPAVAARVAYGVPSTIMALPLAVTMVWSPEAKASAIDLAASSGSPLNAFVLTEVVDRVPFPSAAASRHAYVSCTSKSIRNQGTIISIPWELPVPEAAMSLLPDMMTESAVDSPAAPAAFEATTALPVPWEVIALLKTAGGKKGEGPLGRFQFQYN